MTKIIVLGAGNMGIYISSNLAEEYDVTLVDNNQAVLDKITAENITKVKADLSDSKTVKNQVADYDLVISALPDSFGYAALKAVIKAGKDVVDISFWEQDQAKLLEIETLAQNHNVTAFIDCGIAPGLSNGLVAFFDKLLGGKTKNVRVYVGGIPKEKERGFFASFSVSTLIEEYIRQALYISNGHLQKVQALSITDKIEFPGVGSLDAAITDGLRSLAANLNHITNMIEFTLRYPGHFHQMKLLGELGYFSADLKNVGKDQITAYTLSQILLKEISEDKVKYEAILKGLGFYDNESLYSCTGQKISPRQVAQDILLKTWKKEDDEKDILVMRVEANDGKTEYTADLYAEHDGTASAMALTTGGTAALAARIILNGKFDIKGVFPLEKVIQAKLELLEYFTAGLQDLGIKYIQNIKELT